MGNSVELIIDGRSYRLTTDDDNDFMQHLADLVSIKILEFKGEHGASPLDSATMAALSFAIELNRTKANKKAPAEAVNDGAHPVAVEQERSISAM